MGAARAGSIVGFLAAIAGVAPMPIQEPGTGASFAARFEGARKDALTRDVTVRQPLTQWQTPSGRLQPTTRSAIMRAPRLNRGRLAERDERRRVRSIVAC